MQYVDEQDNSNQAIVQNQEAMNVLYDSYERLVYSFAYRITQDADLAKQATEKAFLALWRRPALSEVETKHFPAAFFSLVRELSLDALKGDLPVDLPMEETPDWHEKGAKLSSSFSQLKESHQDLLMWIYFDGLSQYAIAKRLNIPTSSVPNRIREALRHLDPTSEKLQSKNSCPFSRKLADYFTFQLLSKEARAFEQHLTSCSRCQGELTEWERLMEDFPFLSKMQVPPINMKEQILTTLSEHQSLNGETPRLPLQQAPGQAQSKWLPVLASALLLSIGANTYLASSRLNKRKVHKNKKSLNKGRF